MKNILTIVCCFWALQTNAQLKHYITINHAAYTNYFNPMKDKLFAKNNYGYGSYWSTQFFEDFLSRFEYKIAKGKWGLAAYLTKDDMDYRNNNWTFYDTGEVIRIMHAMIGLNVHYEVLSRKRFEIHSFLGVNYGWYYADPIEKWYLPYPLNEFSPLKFTDECLGFQGGINVVAPIWKGLFVSSHLRYTLNPFTEHTFFRQNLMWELGIGYKLGRKASKQ